MRNIAVAELKTPMRLAASAVSHTAAAPRAMAAGSDPTHLGSMRRGTMSTFARRALSLR